jgi:hypothetical protein
MADLRVVGVDEVSLDRGRWWVWCCGLASTVVQRVEPLGVSEEWYSFDKLCRLEKLRGALPLESIIQLNWGGWVKVPWNN